MTPGFDALRYDEGEDSPWWPYLALLPPAAEPLPYLWDEEEAAELLEGTEVMGRAPLAPRR